MGAYRGVQSPIILKIMKIRIAVISLIMCLGANLRAQTWQFTGSLNTERRLETINVLQNGKVLVTGGDDMEGNALASCEIYDPATASWSYAASMQFPRERHTSNELSDGRIVIIGGNTNNINEWIATPSIEIYDPSTDTWTPGGSMYVPRENHTSTLINDSMILISGGLTGQEGNWQVLTECEIYNVNSLQCTVTGSMSQLRHDHAAALLSDGTVLVAGGRTGGAGSDYLAECEIFNPSSGTWAIAPPMPEARIAPITAVFSDNSVLIAGGRKDDNDAAEAADVYSPGAPAWTAVQNILVPSTWQGGTVLPGDRLLMTGGIIGGDWSDPSGQSPVNTPTCEWYDKPNQQWYYAPTMNEPRAEHGAVTFTQTVNSGLPTQLVLVVGGIIGVATVTNTCEVLDVGSGAIANYIAHQESIESAVAPANAPANMLTISYTNNGPALDLVLAASENVTTELVSIDGRVVFNMDEQLAGGEHVLNLPSSLASGMYLVRVNAGGNVMTSKIQITQ